MNQNTLYLYSIKYIDICISILLEIQNNNLNSIINIYIQLQLNTPASCGKV